MIASPLKVVVQRTMPTVRLREKGTDRHVPGTELTYMEHWVPTALDAITMLTYVDSTFVKEQSLLVAEYNKSI